MVERFGVRASEWCGVGGVLGEVSSRLKAVLPVVGAPGLLVMAMVLLLSDDVQAMGDPVDTAVLDLWADELKHAAADVFERSVGG
jgi:hypothetical protein